MSLDVMMERLHTDPSMQRRLAFLSNLQESEADQLGMVLVRQSGWPASAMVGFYQKLAMMDAPSVMASSHPTVASRVSMAKGMALLLAD
jgi:predicted Zn-dependent protease